MAPTLPRSRFTTFVPTAMPQSTKASGNVSPNITSLKLLDKGHCSGTMLSTLISYANNTSINIDKRMSETQTDISEKLDRIFNLLDSIPAMNIAVLEVQSSFNELLQKFDDQNFQLEEISKSNSLLIEENKLIKNELNELTVKLADVESIVQSNKCNVNNNVPANQTTPQMTVDQLISHPIMAPVHASHPDAGQLIFNATSQTGSCDEESSNIMVSDFVDCSSSKIDPHKVVYAALRAVDPELRSEDIISVKELQKRKPRVTLGTNNKNTGNSALLVQLASSAKVESIITSKSKFTRLSTADIDLAFLEDKDIKSLKDTPILIHEYLRQEKYKRFTQLKTIAKNLGFKYVWHRRGHFLARRKDGENTFTFSTAADLDAIAKSFKNVNP